MEMTPDRFLMETCAGEHAHEELRLRDRHLPGAIRRHAERFERPERDRRACSSFG